MRIISVKNNAELCEKVKAYCKENWSKVYESFAATADKSITAEKFPQTWVIFGCHSGEDVQRIIGFYQLAENDHLTVHNKLTPFIRMLFVDPKFRNGELYGKAALDHAREMLGKMGFDTAYLHTDLIGYYEKYGFDEIGLDITDYGSPTKIYSADTITDIRYEIYDKHNPMPDHISLAAYMIQNPLHESAAWHLWFGKRKSFFAHWKAHSFTVTSFINGKLVGKVNFLQNPDNLNNWCLGDLCVDDDCCRRGIASKMLRKGFEYIARTANGGEYIYSYIVKNDTPAIGLYKKLGFTDLREIRPFEQLIFKDEQTTWVKYL